MKNTLILFLMVFCLNGIQGQNVLAKEGKVDALNSVMHFVNEGSHGLLIVHRMLEVYNQDINKYVDLDSYKVNDYSNKDLPKDIFEDPENWFYDTSPYEWYEIALKKTKANPYPNSKQIIAKMTKMKSIMKEINQLRFDLDDKIINQDLTKTSALNLVYEDLERGVDLYESYFNIQTNLLRQVSTTYKPLTPNANEVQFPALYQAMTGLYLTTRNVLLAVRNKDDENIARFIAKQQSAIRNFESIDLKSFGSTRLTSRKVQRIKKYIEEYANLSLQSAKDFYETAYVPVEYKQYGKFYYYYNSELINKFNRYGSGIVFEMNKLLDILDIPALLYTELPHYYKFILPRKLKEVEYIKATDSNISVLPIRLKDREIIVSTQKIKVDSLKFEISLFDPMVEDADTISLNFNGDWIIEDMRLKAERKNLKIQLNSEGKNYFILHAVNVGRQPPNTMAINYYFEGQLQQITLNSDLNVSEMIEIEYIE